MGIEMVNVFLLVFPVGFNEVSFHVGVCEKLEGDHEDNSCEGRSCAFVECLYTFISVDVRTDFKRVQKGLALLHSDLNNVKGLADKGLSKSSTTSS